MLPLKVGDVDALFRVITLGNPTVKELLLSDSVQLLPIDQIDALQLSLPYLDARVIPKGTYDGGQPIPAEDLPVVAVNALLLAHQELPDEVVSDLTRTLYEHRNELVNLYPKAAMIRLDTSGEDLGLPLHKGARAFYTQDQPEFIVEYAEPIGLLRFCGSAGNFRPVAISDVVVGQTKEPGRHLQPGNSGFDRSNPPNQIRQRIESTPPETLRHSQAGGHRSGCRPHHQ